MAINDLVVVRDGPGQVLVSVAIDGELYVRAAGMAWWWPPSSARAHTHGSGRPDPGSRRRWDGRHPAGPARGLDAAARGRAVEPDHIEVEPGYGGVRYELDGRDSEIRGHELTVARRETYATLVTLADEEPRFTGLRRRGLLLDSPRVLVRDERPDSDPEHRPV